MLLQQKDTKLGDDLTPKNQAKLNQQPLPCEFVLQGGRLSVG